MDQKEICEGCEHYRYASHKKTLPQQEKLCFRLEGECEKLDLAIRKSVGAKSLNGKPYQNTQEIIKNLKEAKMEESIPEEKPVTNETDWSAYDKARSEEMKFVKLESGKTAKLLIANWGLRTVFDKPGLGFDVLSMNGEQVTEKVYETSSKRFIDQIRPILTKVEKEGKSNVEIEVMTIGDSFERRYVIKEVS